MDKVMEMISRLETLEDFTKIEYSNGRISEQVMGEQLRLMGEIKDIGLK